MIERKGGIWNIYPILDWPDLKANHYLLRLPDGWRHPHYKPGVQSKGGMILPEGTEKTECGLHERTIVNPLGGDYTI